MDEQNPYQAPSTATPHINQGQRSGSAIASLVLGLLSLVGWCLPIVGGPMTIVGIVLGFKGRTPRSEGMALAGIILNFIGLALSVFNAALGAYLAIQGQLK